MNYLLGFTLLALGSLLPAAIADNCRPDLQTPAAVAGFVMGCFLSTIGLLICASRPDR